MSRDSGGAAGLRDADPAGRDPASQAGLFDAGASAPDVDIASYNVILVNSSAGKDSQAMLAYLVELVDVAGVDRSRMVVVHADLGRVEWTGTRDLAEEQARFYGLRFEVVRREIDGDLLGQIEARGKFPSSAARFCTSDQKTSQVAKLITRLAAEHRGTGATTPARILNCLGIRAQESPVRAQKHSFGPDPASNTRRHVDRWLPIFTWSETEVWDTIRQSGLRHHKAYDLGMSRLSCCFCVIAGRRDLVLAAQHNPELAAEYAAVEARIGHTFQADLSMARIIAEAGAAR